MKTSERRPWVARIGIFCVLVGAMVSCGDNTINIGGDGCVEFNSYYDPLEPFRCGYTRVCNGNEVQSLGVWVDGVLGGMAPVEVTYLCNAFDRSFLSKNQKLWYETTMNPCQSTFYPEELVAALDQCPVVVVEW